MTATIPAGAAPALLEVGGDRPLLLEPGRAWTVAHGRIDVFATRVERGEPAGPRTHLFRVERGEALFGAARHPAGLALLAVGGPSTRLAPLEAERLRAGGAGVEALVHGWIGRVWEGLAETAPQKRQRSLETGADAVVEAGACLVAADDVAWVEQLRGSARIVGRDAGRIEAGEMVPVAGRGWLATDEAGAVRLRSTAELMAGEAGRRTMHAALSRLHAMLLGVTAERLEEEAAAGRARLQARLRAGQSTLRGAVTRLAATLDAGEAASPMRLRVPEEGRGEDALAASVRLVLGSMGIEAAEAASRVDAEHQSRDPLGALSRAYRVRSRRVVLREGWWRSEAGPLLARYAEDDRRPVALLPRTDHRSGYLLCDPAARTTEPVTEAVAAKLGPLGFSFYRPFAARALGIGQVLRFGLQGARIDLLTLGAMATLMALLGLVSPLAIGVLFNSIIPGAERGQLVQLTAVLVVCALATAAFQVVRGIALLRVESRMSASIQAAVWDRLLSLPLPFFRDYTAGDLATRAMGVEEIRRLLSGAVMSGLLAGLFSLVNFFLLFRYDAGLAFAAAGLIVVALLISLGVSWLQLRQQREILRVRSRTSGVVLQLLSGVAKLKMVGAEVQAFGIWSRLFAHQREHQFRARVAGNWLNVFNAAFPLLCSVVLFRMVAARAAEGSAMATGDFLGFVAAFNLCLAGALAVSTAAISALAAVPLYEQVKPILHALPEVHAGKGDPGELTGAIELHRVNFRYAPQAPLTLRDVSIRIRPGEFVAFVGPSGSGKSTLFRLLLGFETPESGSVSYDEQDLAGLDIQAVRRQIGVVMQSGKLMAGDVFTNIVGSSPATLDEAWEAARMAGLDEDLKQMPMGMHTVINEGGSTLSGGQRQRLMIARAVVNRPRILLFDEATSALDNRTQAIVGQSLDRLKATRVVVAHRLSTILNADRIYVVKAGEVVESGTYQELMDGNGVFAEMARRQTA